MMNKIRVVIAGGGTGGHIYPALAIASGLLSRYEAEILYLGVQNSLEERLAKAAGYDFCQISAAPLAGSFRRTIKAVSQNLIGCKQAKKIIKEFRADLVIGTGGYVAAPVVLAGTKLKIPTLIHEQNAFPGRANTYLSSKVDRVCLTFEAAKEHFPQSAKTVLTGLPVRRAVLEASKDEALKFFNFSADQQVVLITGGSQGSKAINTAALSALPRLLKRDIQIIFLTGIKNFDEVQGQLKVLNIFNNQHLQIMPYLDKMEYALAAADLAVGRAGASFISELLARGIPSVLVPYPFAAGNHQQENASSLEKQGAAVLLKENAIKEQTLGDLLEMLLADRQKLYKMSAAAAKMGEGDALQKILSVCHELLAAQKRN